VGASQTWDGYARLGPRCCVFRMSMDDTTDLRKNAIQNQVRGEVRGGPIVTLNNCSTEVADHHVLRLELRVWHSAGFDDYETLLARNAARITESEEHETATHNLQVRLKHLFL